MRSELTESTPAMNDRELLKAAAKAAGYELKLGGTGLDRELFLMAKPYGEHFFRVPWNPLINDGDRYRLAKDCNLDINFANKTVTAFRNGCVHCCYYFGDHPDDESQKVVRAAASLGEKKR